MTVILGFIKENKSLLAADDFTTNNGKNTEVSKIVLLKNRFAIAIIGDPSLFFAFQLINSEFSEYKSPDDLNEIVNEAKKYSLNFYKIRKEKNSNSSDSSQIVILDYEKNRLLFGDFFYEYYNVNKNTDFEELENNYLYSFGLGQGNSDKCYSKVEISDNFIKDPKKSIEEFLKSQKTSEKIGKLGCYVISKKNNTNPKYIEIVPKLSESTKTYKSPNDYFETVKKNLA